MTITVTEFQQMLVSAADALHERINEFSRIDSLFGDGDHGVTMERISKVIKEIASLRHESSSSMFRELAHKVMNVSGGSAGPLYGMVFEGFADGLEGVVGAGTEEIRAMFTGSLESLSMVSKAKEGDKTMMDVLIVASRAADTCRKELPDYFLEVAEAAREGAERTKEYQAKFGRARFHKEATIGTMDAGACSLATMISGMAAGLV